MDIASVAQRRYTSKAYDPSRQIPQEIIDRLLTVLRFSPSSVNLQPWHFVVAGTPQGKARIADTMSVHHAYNEPKIRLASHAVVICVRTRIDDAYLEKVLAKEEADGRFPTPDAKIAQRNTRHGYLDVHRYDRKDAQTWMERQTYIALGMLLLAAGAEGIDATPIEGFNAQAINQALGLSEKGLSAVVLVGLGYRGARDFNATLPKSRLAPEDVFTLI